MRASIKSLMIDRFGGLGEPTYRADMDADGVVIYQPVNRAPFHEPNTWRLSDSSVTSLKRAISASKFFDAEVPEEVCYLDASSVGLEISMTDGRHRQVYGIVSWKPGVRLAAAIDKHLGIVK